MNDEEQVFDNGEQPTEPEGEPISPPAEEGRPPESGPVQWDAIERILNEMRDSYDRTDKRKLIPRATRAPTASRRVSRPKANLPTASL